MHYKNKVVWVTGASSGIGKAVVIELSKLGANIIISSRNKAQLNLVRNHCTYPEKVKILPLDLNLYADFTSKVEEAIKLFGTIDILINNGGISQRSLAIETDIAVDERIFKTNYFGTIALTKALLPYFTKLKKGHFVVITSVVGKIGTPLRSSYAASKHALHGFFDSLRAEIYNDAIAVTLICPGYIKTNVSINALTGDGSIQNTMDEATNNGMLPELFAKKLLKAVARKTHEVVIGGTLEKFAVWLKRCFPKIITRMIRKIKVT